MRRQPGSRKRSQPALSKWKAWSIIALFLCLTGVLLWMGLAIVVRCDRVREGRVDVTVERRFLGLLTLSTESVPDVIKADIEVVSGRTSGGGRQTRGSTVKLELTPRNGPVCLRNRFGPSFGTQPDDMARQIEQFIKESSAPSLTTWWMPWLVNVGALPFVLVLGAILGAMLLRALEFLKPAA
jgi:hypothetical protein